MDREGEAMSRDNVVRIVIVVVAIYLVALIVEHCPGAENPLVTRDLSDPFLSTTDATSAFWNTATGKVEATVTTATVSVTAKAMPWSGLSAIPTTVTVPNVTNSHHAHLADAASWATGAQSAVTANSATFAGTAANMLWSGLQSIPTTVTAPNVTYSHAAHLADYATWAGSVVSLSWFRLTDVPTTMSAAQNAHHAHLADSSTWATGAQTAVTAASASSAGSASNVLWSGLQSIPTTVTAPNVTYSHGAHVADAATYAWNSDKLDGHQWAEVPTALANPFTPANGRQSVTGTLLATALRTSSLVTSAGATIKPSANATNGGVAQADGTQFIYWDSTNKRLGLNTAATYDFDVSANGSGNSGQTMRVASNGNNYMLFTCPTGGSKISYNPRQLGTGTAGAQYVQFDMDGGDSGGSNTRYAQIGAISKTVTAGTSRQGALQLSVTRNGTLTELFRLDNIGVGLGGVSAPSAVLHLAAGTTAASTAPFKFTSGALNATAEAMAVEALTDNVYFTITTGAARKAFVLDDGTRLTAGTVPVATTNGRLADSGATTVTLAAISGNAHTASNTNLFAGHTLSQVIALANPATPGKLDLLTQTTASGTVGTIAVTAGCYRIDAAIVGRATGTPTTQGQVTVTVSWQDAIGSTQSLVLPTCTFPGPRQSNMAFDYIGYSPITVSVVLNVSPVNANYDLHVRAIREE
jgi:hypothetical protein